MNVAGAARRHLALVLILFLAVVLRVQYLGAPLLDAHRWRQVDTASIARTFFEGTINPLKPEANWGGPHGYVESEFPLLPAIAAVLYRLFGPDEIWGRLVVIFFSTAAVLLTYLLARDLVDEPAGLAAATLIAASPGAVFYGRAYMPDSLMVCFSLGAILGFVRYFRTGSGRALAFGGLCLALAVLVKLPGVIVVAPILGAAWRARRWRVLRDWRFVATVVGAGLLGLVWYVHAFGLYRETGLTFGVLGTTKTYPMTVSPGPWPTAFSKWSTTELLTSSTFYDTLLTRLWVLHLTPPGFALAAIGFLLWRRIPDRAVVDSWLLAMVAFVLAAGYGHMGHDYYQLPFVPIGAVYFGAAARPVFDPVWIRSTFGAARAWPPVIGVTVGALALVAFFQSGVIEHHFRPDTPDVRMQRAGQAIDQSTDNNALMVVVDDYGVNSPMLLYFAHARGWSLDADTVRPQVVRGLEGQGAKYFATTRWAQVSRRQPDLKLYLESRRVVDLNGAPPNTMLFDLTAPRE
jgi:4-amino-4-deoxy-L-arabinose transferase-like glycosyltransferase